MDTGTLSDRVYAVLRERILQGTYASGQRLNLAELARDLRVSNTPVREAVARLGRVGLVEVVPYSGPRVRHLNPKQVADLFDVRIALEELAVRLVDQREDDHKLQGIARALLIQGDALKTGDRRARIEADRAFHDALVQASDNSVLIEMLPTLSDRTRLLLELGGRLQAVSEGESEADPAQPIDPQQDKSWLGHRQVLTSLLDGEVESAVRALHVELASAKERMVKRMTALQEPHQ